MLHIEKKEYNLNMLLNFEMLKEILIKLSISQEKLEDEIKSIHQMNSKRDDIIIKLEKTVFNTSDHHEQIQNQIEEREKENKETITESKPYNEFENNNEIQDKEEYNKDENKANMNKNISYEKSNEKKIIEEQKNDIEENGSNKINNNQNIPTDNNIEKNLTEKNFSGKKRDISIDDNNINSYSSPKSDKNQKEQSSPGGAIVSPDLIAKIMKQLKEQSSKLNILETQLKSVSKNIKNEETHLKNHILDNESEIKLINDRINSLLQKNEEYDQKLDNLMVKTSELDVFSMFKDSGDGTIDATKLLVKSLEEKIFKKFELVDARYKKDSLDNLKMKTNIENITPKLDQFNRELVRISDMNKQQKDDLDNYKKENQEQNLDNINNIDNDINQKLLDLKNELENNLKNKMKLIENQLKILQNSNNDNNNTFDLLKLGLGNNGLDSEASQALEKKINDLRKKTNDLENTLKLFMDKKEIDSITKEIKDLKLLIDKKITKDDLKELYNFHLSDLDEINDIKDRESITYDELRKTIKDLQNMQQRMESISGNLALLQNTPSNGNAKIIDFSKYVDNQKLTEALKPFLREFDKVYKEIDSFRRDLNEVDNQNKNYIKNSISKLDEDFNNKINELKVFIQKKYLEKFEFHKTIKSLEVQIKSLNDEPKKNDADNWLLAKRPLKCFNCASCEANIKNDNYNTADYLPWKKYPRGEKIHRMGQGFSHMLQMMTSEFIKSIEKNEFPMEYELSARNNTTNNISNTISNQFDKSTVTGFVINNKEQEDGLQNLKKSKMKLPKVKQFSKPKIRKYEDNLPISDDEFPGNNIEVNKDLVVNSSSPKILKITKKTKQKTGGDKGGGSIYGNLMTMQGAFSQRDKNNPFSRNNLLKNEKNEYVGTLSNSP